MNTEERRLRIREMATNATDPPPFNLIEWRTDQAKRVLANKVPAIFASAQPSQPQVRSWVAQFLTDPSTTPALVLAGPTGTGKTYEAYGAIRHLALSNAQRGVGLNWRATSHPDLNAAQRPKPDNSHTWALDPYLDADLVFLDDLGAGKQTDWTGDTLYRLVDHRWTRQLPTIYATNLTARDLDQAVGGRVVSRLGSAIRVSMKGQDRRWAVGAA